jgi:methanogenic corrinoid protein MtbC1
MPATDTSPTYNLGAIIQETGLNADTLRAWERRYNLPQPARSEGGQRLYSPRDLDILKWLIARQEEGLRISQAAKLWHNQIASGNDPLQENLHHAAPVSALIIKGKNIESIKSQWVSACMSFNEVLAEQILSEAFSQYSPETVCFEVLFAGLSEIGKAWYTGEASIQQEHFASALIARRLNSLIAGAPPPSLSERIVVATPPNEEHTLSTLLITYLMRRRGWNVIFLGPNVPLDNFRNTIESLQPDLVLLTAQQLHTAASLLDLAEALDELKIKLVFGGLIFNINSRLKENFPGRFLGEKLENAVSIVELELNSPSKIFKKLNKNHSQLMEHFRSELPRIENRIRELIPDYPQRYQTSSRFLSRDILAALRLGDISLLSGDIDWVSGLLVYAKVPENALIEFIQIYRDAVSEILGQDAEVILTWLRKEIERLTKNI